MGNFRELGEILNEYVNGPARPQMISSYLEIARNKREANETKPAKQAFEKVLLSLDFGNAQHHLAITAEHLASDGLYQGITLPYEKGMNMFRWSKILSSPEEHLKRASKLMESGIPELFLGALHSERKVDYYKKGIEKEGSLQKEIGEDFLTLLGKVDLCVGNMQETATMISDILDKFQEFTFPSYRDMTAKEIPFLNIGYGELYKGNLDSARECFTTLERVGLHSEASAMGIALTYLQKDLSPEAEQVVHDFEEKHPESLSLYLLLGIHEAKKGKFKEAVKYFGRVEERCRSENKKENNCSYTLKKSAPQTMHWYARSLFEEGSNEQAISLLTQVLKQPVPWKTYEGRMHNLLGIAYLKDGENELAKPHVEKAVWLMKGEYP